MPTELELEALTAWTPSQQAALNHRMLAEQARRDADAEEGDKKKKDKKDKKDTNKDKPEQVTAQVVLGGLMKAHIPALYEFLDLFGPPHIGLPILLLLHIIAWYAPPYLSPLLPLFITHILPGVLALKSLFRPSSNLHKAHDEAKAEWSKTCSEMKKSGKDKAEFPEPPAPPESWALCVRERAGWLAYWAILGGIEWVEEVLFGQEVWGLIWWPKIKIITCVALYWIWETKDSGMKMGAAKLVEPLL